VCNGNAKLLASMSVGKNEVEGRFHDTGRSSFVSQLI
jgi:hypothetical protein